jgi:hypothetical protein
MECDKTEEMNNNKKYSHSIHYSRILANGKEFKYLIIIFRSNSIRFHFKAAHSREAHDLCHASRTNYRPGR